MIDWTSITTHDAIRRYLSERRRLGSAISTGGLDGDGKLPGNRPSDDWEDLISLFAHPVEAQSLEVLEVKLFGWSGVILQEQEEYPDGVTRAEWEAIDPAERRPMRRWWEWQSMPLRDHQVAEHVGIDVSEVKRLIHETECIVAERIGEKRHRVTTVVIQASVPAVTSAMLIDRVGLARCLLSGARVKW